MRNGACGVVIVLGSGMYVGCMYLLLTGTPVKEWMNAHRSVTPTHAPSVLSIDPSRPKCSSLRMVVVGYNCSLSSSLPAEETSVDKQEKRRFT